MDVLRCTPEEWIKQEEEWLKHITDDSVWDKIPLLNVHEVHNLQDSRLVKFRGMIQDMHGPEFYMEQYEIVNESTQQRCIKNGKYVDVENCQPGEILAVESPSVVRSERQSYVVISIPGINTWVQEIERQRYLLPTNDNPSSSKLPTNSKRPLEEAMDVENTETPEPSPLNSKKQCTIKPPAVPESVLSAEHILNFPLPDPSGKVCHLKVYKDADELKLNAVFEFVGFLSINPLLACQDQDEGEEDMEFQTRNPPPSLVPRIHCVSFRTLPHNNPLVSTEQTMDSYRMQYVKKELQILLTQLLLGDEIAAEYLIYHLISEVYLRKDLMALGKFSLNISNVPVKDLDYGRELYSFIELFVTKSHYLPMSLENMNELAFVPKKDYDCNRLTSSILQLSSNTHLVLDETQLSPGKLNEAGVKGIRALNDAIKNQKTMYDFVYYQSEFECNIPFLVFSEGKSMLPSDYHIVLNPDQIHLDTFKEILEAARHFLKPELLDQIRTYLTLARMIKYELSENVQELIQTEFVNLRQTENLSAEDLHKLLVLTRLICVSQGKSTLDEECWNKACSLEKARKSRLSK